MAAPLVFADRRDAGRRLAADLRHHAGREEVIVLALPRGGVPVAHEVARALEAPLDVFLVRKLGVPGNDELAMGAIAMSGVRVVNDEVVRSLAISEDEIEAVAAREARELERRERLYRGGRPPLDLHGRTVVLVDDGLATGSTMKAAIKAARKLGPARIVAAVPVGSSDTCEEMAGEADEVVCATTPHHLVGVGQWYADFTQTADAEVRALLASPTRGTAARAAPSGDAHAALRRRLVPLSGGPGDYDNLLDAIGDARFVLLGEASHGTHEFYRERGRITRRLIEEKGFAAVALEADWPDAYRVNRYVRGAGQDRGPDSALRDFRRFPSWMWRNTSVADFVDWLRRHNDGLADGKAKVGFYGLDLYSMHASMAAVLDYLDRADPDAAHEARRRYSCFDHFGPEPQTYGAAAGRSAASSCEDEVVDQLITMLSRRPAIVERDAWLAREELFAAQQNARLVRSAEAYYRAMFAEPEITWNLRDRHMADALEALAVHLGAARGGPAKIVVWAHNSHLGDARATDRRRIGEINLGQLVREKHGRDAYLVGFTTHHGEVTAADDWGGEARRKTVRPALPDSYEALLHELGEPRFHLDLGGHDDVPPRLLERAIGVVYRPETERISHYFHADLAGQFDAVLHFDETRAVEPLERTSVWQAGDLAETYPFGV